MKYAELLVLIPGHCLEDFPTELSEKPAASLLNAFSVLWHPRLLASAETLPEWKRADMALTGEQPRLVIVPLSSESLTSPESLAHLRDSGSVVITGEHERQPMLDRALLPLEANGELDADLVADFLALGTLHLQTELLTRNMRNFSQIDEAQLKREAIAAAQAALSNDAEATRAHLSQCFEVLQSCRERFYPVESYLIDLCLVTPDLADEHLRQCLSSALPVNYLAPAADWKTITEADADWPRRVQEAVKNGSAELLGGDDQEIATSLSALDATLWQLQTGRARLHELFGVVPTVWLRKRYGVGPYMPQILDRLNYKGGLHLALDDGLYPDEEQTQLRWVGRDGSVMNSFSRIPLAADSAASFLRFPQRMAESMDYDHVAAVAFARWPRVRNPFLEDFRRAHAYRPVLGRFVTCTDYFEHSSTPGRQADFRAGKYLSPTLIQDVARRGNDPLSRHIRYWRRRLRFQTVDWLAAISKVLPQSQPRLEEQGALEAAVEAATLEASNEVQSAADEKIDQTFAEATARFCQSVCRDGASKPGLLVINPLSFPRKCVIVWPEGTMPPQHPSILHRQIDAPRAQALVELPPCGFVWFPCEPIQGDNTSPGKQPMADEERLRSDQFEVQMSDVTGGIAQIMTYRRSPNRISQQIALRFPQEKTIVVDAEEDEEYRTFYTSMRQREARVLSQGPVVGEIETLGDLIDVHARKVVATYRQRTRVTRGRPIVDVDIEISLVDEMTGDPWTNYLGCRFAWKHSGVALTASMQQGAHAVTQQRIEAPQFIEIADGEYRTTLLMPGLPFHRRTGDRMVDTLLIVEGESQRRFRFGIAIDHNYPMQAWLDQFSVPVSIPTSTSPSSGVQSGWLFQVSAANVQLTRILPSPTGEGYRIRLLETEGRARNFSVRCFRPPTSARQVDFNGEVIVPCRVEGDAVQVEISPYEICDLQFSFGASPQ